MSDYKQAHDIGIQSLQRANGMPFVVVPEGGQVKAFPEVLERPLRLVQNVSLHTAKDFIAYVNRFADQNSFIFVNVLGGKIQAILDYHEAYQDDAVTSDQAKN